MMEPGDAESAAFGSCAMKYANFPLGLKIRASLLEVVGLPIVDVVPDGISAPESVAIENASREFLP